MTALECFILRNIYTKTNIRNIYKKTLEIFTNIRMIDMNVWSAEKPSEILTKKVLEIFAKNTGNIYKPCNLQKNSGDTVAN